ncbi:hypothetical protein ABW21_db0202206 [Orbilia brochopaga]|nr:hypothetical protein ABW21_db0202206 [Drechslerella brochopaga]
MPLASADALRGSPRRYRDCHTVIGARYFSGQIQQGFFCITFCIKGIKVAKAQHIQGGTRPLESCHAWLATEKRSLPGYQVGVMGRAISLALGARPATRLFHNHPLFGHLQRIRLYLLFRTGVSMNPPIMVYEIITAWKPLSNVGAMGMSALDILAIIAMLRSAMALEVVQRRESISFEDGRH